MVCHPSAFSDSGRLDILRGGKTTRKKRRMALRKVDEALAATMKSKLQKERAVYMDAHPTLGILGAQLVCPDSLIKIICDSAKFISVSSDMDLFCLRQELKEPFFNAIVNS